MVSFSSFEWLLRADFEGRSPCAKARSGDKAGRLSRVADRPLKGASLAPFRGRMAEPTGLEPHKERNAALARVSRDLF